MLHRRGQIGECGPERVFGASKWIDRLTWFGIGWVEAGRETIGRFARSNRCKIDSPLKIIGLSSDKGRMET